LQTHAFGDLDAVHSSITVTTGTYVEVIEAVQRDALDSMGSLLSVESGANASH
jgi:hypothetical protein